MLELLQFSVGNMLQIGSNGGGCGSGSSSRPLRFCGEYHIGTDSSYIIFRTDAKFVAVDLQAIYHP
jgi:hypothetical protein